MAGNQPAIHSPHVHCVPAGESGGHPNFRAQVIRLHPTAMRISLLLLAIAALAGGFSCARKTVQVSDPEAFQAYLAGYTGSVVSRTSPVVITFTAPYGQDLQDKKPSSSLLRLTPDAKGSLRWSDAYTLRFDPDEPLKEGTEYLGTLDLGGVVDGLPDSLKAFTFRFRTREQYMRMTLQDLTIPEESQPDAFALTGVLYTHDYADAALVEKCLKPDDFLRKSEISWTHDEQGMTHTFRLYPLRAGKEDLSVHLAWDGAPLGLSRKGRESILLPSSTKFRVMKATAGQGTQSEVRLSFSQLLDKQQDLTGMIYLTTQPDQNPRFLIEGNQVICYFSSRLEGPQTLMVRNQVRSYSGQLLDQPFTQELDFTQTAPGVRLVGSGNILPNSGQLYFPFEAVNLNAVDVEVFRIHHKNMLQFLQVNPLEGDYELERVGEIVWEGKVDLTALNPERNQHEYVRYALDLARLIEPDPRSLYQIRIGFWKEYSSYACGEETVEGAPAEDVSPEEEDEYEDYEPYGGESRNLMHFYYGRRGWHRDYKWDDRENPCKEEYYHSERFVNRNILASNLGITAKWSEGGDLLVAATDLRTSAPLSGAEVILYNYQMQPLHKGMTDGEGLLLAQHVRKAEFAVVNKGPESGYLVLREHQSLSTSDFPTEGTAVQQGLRGWAYAERGVWRPGDSIHLHFILADPERRLPARYPVTMELSDPRGRQILRLVNGSPVGPVYAFPLAVDDEAPTGVWHARFLAGSAVFHHYLRVETIKPNRYKLQLDLGKSRLGQQTEPVSGTLRAAWLHGAPAAGQEAKIDVRAVSVPTRFKGYESFRFDHPDREKVDQAMAWHKDRTAQDGTVRLEEKTLLGSLQPPGMMRVDFTFRVGEPGGGFSQDFLSLPYDPYTHYAGVRLPVNAEGSPAFDREDKVTLRFVSLTPDGKAAPGRKLEVRLIRKEWQWWWERYRDNRTVAQHAEIGEPLQTRTLTTDQKGEAQWSLAFGEYDRYLVEVCDPASGHCSGEDIYIWNRSDPGRSRELRYLDLKADKEVARPGEEVRLSLPPGEGGHALVTLESGTRILEARMIPLEAAPKTHNIRITPDMVPNIYVHMSLLQPHNRGNDLPVRLYGILPVRVEDPATILEPQVQAPSEMRPDKTYALQVSEKKGRAMTYTIALVDEGLLDLTRFKTPDPHKNLFSKQASGVKTWDLFDQVLGGYSGELKRIVAIGGDGSAPKPDGNPKASRFKPAVVHLGPFRLAAGKTARHEIAIPAYVGSVRLMLVAAGDLAYGSTEKTIPVRKPLMAAATLPRQLGLGESFDLAVTLFAMDPKVKEATVHVKETSGLFRFSDPSGRQVVRFGGTGEKTLHFPLVTGEKSGVARVEIEVEGGGEMTKQKVEIAVRNPNPRQTVTHEKMLQPGEAHTFLESLPGTPGTNEAVLHLMTLPPMQLGNRLNFLMNYPFGCLEQTTSAAFPLVFLPEVMELPEPAVRDMRDRINRAIRRILSMKDANGRLMYWPEGNYTHPWSEVNAVLFLALAKEAGYQVPEGAWQSVLEQQKRLAHSWDPSTLSAAEHATGTPSVQAYRLYTLAVAGSLPLGALNRLRERPDLNTMDRWLVAGAYARAGKSDIARSVRSTLGREIPAYRDRFFSFGSDIRDLGLITMALLDGGDPQGAFQVLRKMAAALNTGAWYSTHSISTALWAYAAYAGRHGKGSALNAVLETEKEGRRQLGSARPLFQQKLAPGEVDQKPVRVQNTGQGPLYVQLALSGRPPAGQETARSRGMDLVIRYQDMEGRPLDIRRLPVGTDFMAVASVLHTGTTDQPVQEVALSQIIPAGWEIRNTRMEAESTVKIPPMSFKYRDIRDDRAHSFFDLRKVRDNQGRTLAQLYYIGLTASYPGRYYLPAQHAEAMYDPDFSATVPGQWVEVYDPSRERENQ